MHIIALCTHSSTIACCAYLTCSSVTIAISFYAFLITQWFVSVCIKHHSCTWLGISLSDSKHLYNYTVLHNVLLLTYVLYLTLFLFVDLWNIKYNINININIFPQAWNLKFSSSRGGGFKCSNLETTTCLNLALIRCFEIKPKTNSWLFMW
jgi:hypothetical protein